ncbi:hypothetical protein [Desulfopila inferna]|uniref:hypothetical protein n=1 Tax=Desulfopila inferna TaxID=468528 RepID=UPI00196549A2|nr:hypothetical protein [Desulfopila inferna]MBM9606615.1 hypothetical protein [Desulfopila inferna]
MQKEKIKDIVAIFSESPGYLLKSGWLRSMAESQAVDADGHPIPWITYPALDFLADRIRPFMTVFEYGSGNSTFWWSERVKRLISCEHDKEWYAEFRSKMPADITYLLRRAKGGSREYAMEITTYGSIFDVVVIDGRDRVDCAKNSVSALRPNGVIVWDNSDRDEYRDGYDFLHKAAFKRLDFWGMGALATRRWCTSIFYRTENCLDI